MRRLPIAISVSFAVSLAVAIGALAQDDPPGDDPPVPNGELQEVARRAGVVAQVGDVEITVGDVEDRINEQSVNLRVNYRDPEEVRRFVRGMVRFELLARAAEREGIAELPDVRETIKQAAVQQLIRRDFDQAHPVEDISDEEVEQYYESHPEEFGRPELRRAAHIAVESREEADRLLARARAADAREFRELARDHSQDPETRLRGGDLRFFGRDGRARNSRDPQVDEGIASAAFALAEVGDVVAEPVAIGERWSVVKLTGRRPAEQRTLAQSAPTIRLRLWRAQRQQRITDFVAELRRGAEVEPRYELLRGIRLDPPPREDQDEEVAARAHRRLPQPGAQAPVRRPDQLPPPAN